MRHRTRLFAAVAASLAVTAGSAAAAEPAKCKIVKAAELPVTMRGTQPLVTVRINGQDIKFMADSGAWFSTVSPQAAARMGLKLGPAPPWMRLSGVGGTVRVQVGVANEMILDGIPLKNVQFLVAEGADMAGDDAAGLLGQNVLQFADVEYDLANGVIRLILPKNCEKNVLAYWHKPDQAVGFVELKPTTPAQPHLFGRAAINGQPIRVMFDTGASRSVLKLPTARRLGFQPTAEGVKAGGLSGGIGRRVMENWLAPFDSFEVGGETIHNTRLRVADIQLEDADMLLGADFFLSHRIYVSLKQHRIFFTYNGGPVFKLDREPTAQPTIAQDVPAAPPVGADAAGGPTDAASYSRRGSASAARRDFPAAIADFTRAVELEPKEPRHYLDRAMARLAARQPVLAMADLDQVLKLKPDDTRALMTRGQLYLRNGDAGRAASDFTAAAKTAPDDSAIRLAIGNAYEDADHFELAIAQYDQWIAAHPKDSQLAMALNARCWARARWGRELETALADCDAALKRGPRVAAIYDSRGLVQLRLGHLDQALADYDQALKLQPKNAWSLYGRGLAKQRMGRKPEGDADIAAALALRPGLPAEARRIGVTEAGAKAD